MHASDFFIGEEAFRVIVPEVAFFEKADQEEFNSRQIAGVMSSERTDRQDEIVIAKGLDFEDFLKSGHFNDNHSQETSAIVGYPEEVKHHEDLGSVNKALEGAPGWTCRGYVLKGTKRADAIWELAKSLAGNPKKKLGFSIEGKIIRRSDHRIEKARIRNVAITNCPVNTDATWSVLTKSFLDSDFAIKSLSAGYATSPGVQSGGGALRTEDLDSDEKDVMEERKRKEAAKLKRAMDALANEIGFDNLLKAMQVVMEERPEFTEEAAACLVVRKFFAKGASHEHSVRAA